MEDPIATFLRDLMQLPGLPGYEAPVRERLQLEWQPLVDETARSRLGSLHALKRGSGPAPRLSVMLTAHMDAVGLMVSGIVEGFLHVTEMGVGGLDPRVLPGQAVVVHGRRGLPGVIALPPPHCLPPDESEGTVAIRHLLVDTGLPSRQVNRLVRTGDLVSFSQPPLEIGEGMLAGHSLDNRASLAALTICLQELQGRAHPWDVFVVASVQEEYALGGAITSAFDLRPSVAVAVDVTYGRGLGQPEVKTFPLGGGPTNGWGPNIHPGIYRAIEAAAERIEVPLTIELNPVHTGTDAEGMQVVAEGIPTGLVGIPLRYMHTPVEVVALTDIRRSGLLLAEFVSSLGPDFLDKLSWD